MHRDNPYLPENTQHDEPGCHYAPSELPRTFTPEDRATLRDAPNWNNELLCHCDPTPEPVSPLSELTAREVEIAIALAHGDSCKEIATKLGISSKTADTHRHSVLKKLGCRNTVDLCRLAIRRGVVLP
jgi:DNA-binding NarL/FixJ family response regulator